MWKKILEGIRKKSSTTPNKQEQPKISDTTARGVLALMVLIFVFQTVTFTIHKCSDKEQANIAYNSNTNSLGNHNSYQQHNYTLFNFNPNTITIDSLKMLGFSEKQALIIIHYREKGGRFRKKEDFAKMYSVSNEKYIELEPYIKIESNSTPSNSAKQPEKAVLENITHKATVSESTPQNTISQNNTALQSNTLNNTAQQNTISQNNTLNNTVQQNTLSHNNTAPQSNTLNNTAQQNTISQNNTLNNTVQQNNAQQNTVSQNGKTAGENQSKGTWNNPKPKVYIDINEADSTTLMSVKGIGPYFCRNILSYRKALGSFYSTDQLLEIKGMDQEKYNRIKDQIFVHPAGVKKFSIAEADKAFLEKHPYIGAYNARGIALFIKNHSKEEITLKALVENNILTVADTLRLHPYIY